MPYGDPPPYVGRRIRVYQTKEYHSLPFEGVVVDHVGDMLCVRDDAGTAFWADTRRIPGFQVLDDATAAAPDPIAAAVAAFKAHPGPLVDTGG